MQSHKRARNMKRWKYMRVWICVREEIIKSPLLWRFNRSWPSIVLQYLYFVQSANLSYGKTWQFVGRSEGRNCRLLNHEHLICMPRNFAGSLLFLKFLGRIQEQDFVCGNKRVERGKVFHAYFKRNIFFNIL